MVKFTIEEIRTLMDYKHNIRNMSGTSFPHPLSPSSLVSKASVHQAMSDGFVLLCSHCSCGPR